MKVQVHQGLIFSHKGSPKAGQYFYNKEELLAGAAVNLSVDDLCTRTSTTEGLNMYCFDHDGVKTIELED